MHANRPHGYVVNNYTVQMMVYEAHIEVESLVSVASIDPYVVAYLSARDKKETKQKTKIHRRNSHPVWNHVMYWSGLEYDEKIRFELKLHQMLGQNFVAGTMEFSVQDILRYMNVQLGRSYCLPFTSKTGFNSELVVSFKITPPIPADAFIYNTIELGATSSSNRASATMAGEDAAHLELDGCFACLLLDCNDEET